MRTRFVVRLPYASDSVHCIEAYHLSKTLSGEETVLLVEDQNQVRKITGRMLRTHGYRALEVESGVRGEDMVTEYDDSLHLVIVDLILPDI